MPPWFKWSFDKSGAFHLVLSPTFFGFLIGVALVALIWWAVVAGARHDRRMAIAQLRVTKVVHDGKEAMKAAARGAA